MLATTKDSAKAVAAEVTAAGGFTATVSDRYGYVSATVPTDKVDAVAKSAAVLAVDLNESIPLPKPETVGAPALRPPRPPSGPGAGTPDDNPYMPTRDIGSVDFKKANPTWDGRGVTIGIIDSGVDLDHPALQKTTTGERKIVDWVTGTDPLLESDGSWRAMLTKVTGPDVLRAGHHGTWTAPDAGHYRFNRVSESISANDEAAGDFNRDGDTTDRWGVLYDEATNDIWVDADQDQAFSESERMRPYKEKFDVGHFGVDNPATAVAESMPFVVEFREDVDLSALGGTYAGTEADFVSIGIVEAAHGTHVAGIAAGHGLFGGAMDGQAPGAKVVSSRACSWGGGCTAVALTDGMVDLVENRGVDVVNMSIGGLPALNDGNNARARLYDRLIDGGVQLVISAGNSGPGINTIGDPSVAGNVISVGSSDHQGDLAGELRLGGQHAADPAQLLLARPARGRRLQAERHGARLGHLDRPDLAAWAAGRRGRLRACRRATPCSTARRWRPRRPRAASPCCSRPRRPANIGVSPRQLRDSLYTSADFVKGVEAIAQGAGQVDVPAAWTLLKSRPTSQDYTVSAPVCTPISDFLATPDQGTGVYNRCDAANGGHVVGVAKTYTVTVTRTSGNGGPSTANLRLVGNDGTFSLTSEQRRHARRAPPRRSRSMPSRAPRVCTRRSSRSTTRPPRWSTTGCS